MSKRKNRQTNHSEYFLAPGAGGQAMRRIRTPHPHDVLCGRGGGINSHEGNIEFREWVHSRKNAYNLAVNKNEKARVAREVMRLVTKQDPPGKFLMRDPSSGSSHPGWWVEIDETKAMAKTSQALREGAPTIRAKHKAAMSSSKRRRGGSKAARTTVRSTTPADASSFSMGPPRPVAPSAIRMSPEAVEQALQTAHAAAVATSVPGKTAFPPLVANVTFSDDFSSTAETPPLLPVSPRGEMPTSFPLPFGLPKKSASSNNMKRSHSLALSDMSTHDMEDDFVNPFEDESVDSRREKDALGSRWRRNMSSTSSHGDMGGIGALLNNSNPSLGRQRSSSSFSNNNNNHQSGRSLFRNVSSRSSMSEWSDVTVPDEGYFVDETDFDEGLKTLMDGSDLTAPGNGDVIPSHLNPFRGGSSLTRRLSPKPNKGGSKNDVTQ